MDGPPFKQKCHKPQADSFVVHLKMRISEDAHDEEEDKNFTNFTVSLRKNSIQVGTYKNVFFLLCRVLYKIKYLLLIFGKKIIQKRN